MNWMKLRPFELLSEAMRLPTLPAVANACSGCGLGRIWRRDWKRGIVMVRGRVMWVQLV